MTMDFNPLWILVALAVLGSIVKGLFWLRDVHNMKAGWQAFAKEIRDDIKKILERIRPPKTIESASPFRLSEQGEKISRSMNAAEWAARVAPGLAPEVAGKQPFEIDQFSGTPPCAAVPRLSVRANRNVDGPATPSVSTRCRPSAA